MTTRTSRTPAISSRDQLVIVPWRDPLIERLGHDALGDYVEMFWLGVLGPTATWLLRRLAVIAVAHPEGHRVDLPALASALGLGWDSNRTNAFGRALQRLMMFGMARQVDDAVAVRTVVPPLSVRHLSRLPEHLQRAHALWSDTDNTISLALAFDLDTDIDIDIDIEPDEPSASVSASAC
jgi:hypothetical protein